MLDLVRLSNRRLFPPGGEDLYRQVARLTDLTPGTEVLDVASGKGIPLEYFVREYGVQGTGVEEDPRLIAEAEAYMRNAGLSDVVSFQTASPDDLPFRDETFDVVVGEVGLGGRVDPKAAIRELTRVTRPGGQVVLVQLVWKAPVDEDRRRILSEHLGARPLMMVEVRRVLLEAGVVDLVTEDWTDEQTAFRPQVKKPFPDFSELFTVKEKLGILRRAWRRWGWRGVLTVFQREAEVHRLLTRERLLGLNLLKGTKSSGEPEGEEPSGETRTRLQEKRTSEGETTEESSGQPDETHPREDEEQDEAEEDLETAGLPLFGEGDPK
jgi:ubiquinone/menaquinone biosynthesis C-methylase UbiE